ncbi:MAG: TonB-dependent receptor [Paludibacteraceae bacterium]|nr:TonB-dependent receptor [Paludibacteraceae bacterium]
MLKQFLKRRAIRFRQFLNKGYAAFCSMHREVQIGRVSALIANLELLKSGRSVALTMLLVACCCVLADDGVPPDGSDIANLLTVDEVSVVASMSQFESDRFRLVSNLSSSEIEQLPVRTVGDLLRYMPGVDLRERGPSGVQADLTMRGGTGRQVKVLLNGVDITDPQTDHYTMDIPVDVELIERVELLQGTNYQLDAFSGAVNIITKSALESEKKDEGDRRYKIVGSLAGGEYGLVNPVLAMRVGKKMWWGNMSASYNRSEGYQTDTDYKISNIYVQTGWRGLSVQVGAQMKDAGANSFYTVKFPNQYDRTRTLIASADYKHNWKSGWSVSGNIYYRGHYDMFETFRDGKDENGDMAPDWYKGANKTWTHTQGLHIEGSWHNEWSKTLFGVDVRDELIRSTSLGDHNRLNVRYFAQERVYWRKLSASLGACGIYNTAFGWDWSMGVNIGYEPLRNWQWYVNMNRAIRVPTYTDLYYTTATQKADPNTRAEKAWQVELSSKYKWDLPASGEKRPFLYADVSAYYRWGRDIIDWVKEKDESVVVWQSMNHSRVNAGGVEIQAGVAGYEYIKRVGLSYSFCDVKADAGEMLSLYALDYMRHKAVLTIEHKIYKGFGASWCMRVEDRAGEYTNKAGVVTPYKTCFLLDGYVYWENKWLRMSVECKNMTNRRYVDIGGVEQPPHWVMGKIRVVI